MASTFHKTILAATAVFLAGVSAAQAAAPTAALAPHKAVYDIQMVSRHSGTPVLNIKGQLSFETQTGCEAWTTRHNFKLYYEYADNPPLLITSDFSTYEAFDGRSFHFSSRRERNGELYEELRGAAAHDKTGGKATYSMPEGLSFDLAPASFFPMGHTIALLKHIRQQDRFFSALVFDGSDDEGPMEVNSFIGGAVQVPPPPVIAANGGKTALDAALLAVPAHRIRMAFFPLHDDKAESDYEMGIVFHENGVISDMLIDYKDFSITQKLIGLEALPPPHCAPARGKAKFPLKKKN